MEGAAWCQHANLSAWETRLDHPEPQPAVVPASWPPASWAAGWPAGGAARAWVPTSAAAASAAVDGAPPTAQQPLTFVPVAYRGDSHVPAPLLRAAPTPQPVLQPPPQSKPEVGKGAGLRGAQAGGLSRQQLRLQQRRKREQDQSRIKGLEQQLCSLMQQLESLSIENQHLKQRQAALNATLDMHKQLQAAAAAARLGGAASSSVGSGSAAQVAQEQVLFTLHCFGSAATGLELAAAGGEEEGGQEDSSSSELDEATVDNLLAELAASAEQEASSLSSTRVEAREATPQLLLLPCAAAGAEVRRGAPQEAISRPFAEGSWFFAASLAQHVSWYQHQVHRLAELLAVLDSIPPRLHRSLEDYKLHEETMDLLTGVLGEIDVWTIHLAALRPEDFGAVLHNNLQELLDGSCPSGSNAAGQRPQGSGSSHKGPRSSSGAGTGTSSAEASIWQELVEELALTPQQEQTLEAHQALFEQRAAALEDSKAAVLAALADAAKRDDKEAALELLQGAEALRLSLQHDMLAKAPVMISLRKVLTPLQMARLTVKCWPFYSTMKNISRAHKQRRLAPYARPRTAA